MKKNLTILLIVSILTFGFVACKTNDPVNNDYSALLIHCWTHSYEENTSENIEVYRHCDYMNFPASRYRQVYNFKENYECEFLVLAPNDAHYLEKGKWEYDENSKIIKILNFDNLVLKEFEINELTDNLLEIKNEN